MDIYLYIYVCVCLHHYAYTSTRTHDHFEQLKTYTIFKVLIHSTPSLGPLSTCPPSIWFYLWLKTHTSTECLRNEK